MNFNPKIFFGRKFEFLCDKFQRAQKFWTCVPWSQVALISEWERMRKSKYTWKSWQFIWAISHTNQANTNSVYFPNGAEKRKWIFAEKVCVSTKCHPNGECNIQLIPANNRRTQIQKWTKMNHSQKMNECVEKIKTLCAHVKKIYMYTLAPRPRKCLCFMCKDSEQSQKKAQFRTLSPAGNFVYGMVWWFFSQLRPKNSNVNYVLNGR